MFSLNSGLCNYYRVPTENELLASPGDKWIGTATTPATAGLAYQGHAFKVLAFVTETTVEIFNSISSLHHSDCFDEESLAAEFADAARQSASTSNPSSSNSDQVKFYSENELKEKARNVLSTELVSILLPELFFHIGKFHLTFTSSFLFLTPLL